MKSVFDGYLTPACKNCTLWSDGTSQGLGCNAPFPIGDCPAFAEMQKTDEQKHKGKTYKDFERINIGASDIASLTIRAGTEVKSLNFGTDGSYYAYIVTEPAEIGAHYTRVASFNSPWIKIYDDEGKTFDKYVDGTQTINVYRAGNVAAIIEFCKYATKD